MFKKKSVKYSLAPQTKFYDTLSLSLSWKPFTMFGNFSNIRNTYCNTDSFGLRYNNFDNEKNYKNINNSIFDEHFTSNKEKAVLIGNSVAFGWGSTSDQNTISNLLNKKSKFHFYNLGVSGFSGFQEIIQFLALQKRLKNIKKLIILSGVIDSFLPYYIKEYDVNFGPFFSNSEFLNVMSKESLNIMSKESLSLRVNSLRVKLEKFFYNKVMRKKINWNKMYELDFHNRSNSKNYQFFNYKKNLNPDISLKFLTDRNLNLWSIIGKGMNIKICYALQPLANWCGKELSVEEKKLFEELDQIDHSRHILSLIDMKKYDLVKKLIIQNCEKYDIEFMDCNDSIKKNNHHKEWLFLDRVHLNDNGNRYISEALLSLI